MSKRSKAKLNWMNNRRGFIFSLEAALSLLLMALMFLSIPQAKPVSMKELLIVQQENDLLKVWGASGFDEASARTDVAALFGTNAELFVGNSLPAQGKEKEGIASEAILLNGGLLEVKVWVIVYVG